MRRTCIFVDGENFRHSVCDLFKDFEKEEYLPKHAKWQAFFDWLSHEVISEGLQRSSDCERVRTYWYVVDNLFTVPSLSKPDEDLDGFIREYRKEAEIDVAYSTWTPAEKKKYCNDLYYRAIRCLTRVKKRFNQWKVIQDEISNKNRSIEFRRSGFLKHNIVTNRFIGEKAVDINLATDLLYLRDIYDVAIIVSGDQDYIPAVRRVKDYGKWVVNVAFKKLDGHLLPGGAKSLNQVTDWSFAIPYQSLRGYLLGGSTELGGFEPLG